MLVVAALLDPLWSWQKENRRRIVLVMDNSASMKAVDGSGSTRLDLAKQAAIAVVRSMRDQDEMAIVSAGGRPLVVWGMTNHQRWLIDAIDELPATDSIAAIEQSVALARRLLMDVQGEGETIVMTDGQSRELETLLSDASVKIYGVGDSQDNIGITRYQVRRSLSDAVGYQILVDVTNATDSATTCRLELDLEGELVDVLPLELEPNQTVTRIVNHTSARGGTMTAKLDSNDAFPVDDKAIALLPTRKPIPVVLASEGNLFISSVLSSIPLVELKVVRELEAAEQLTKCIHVFDRVVPKILPHGPVLVIDPQTNCDLWSMGNDIEQPIVASVDESSQLTQHLRLDNVLFPGANQLVFKGEVQALIRDPFEVPLLARIQRPGGDVVILSCSLEKGDLPLRIAFPVLIKNTIEWFQGDSGELRHAASSGDIVVVDLNAGPLASSNGEDPQGARATNPQDANNADQPDVSVVVQAKSNEDLKALELIAPDGTATPITRSLNEVTVGPLQHAGMWLVRPINQASHHERDRVSNVKDNPGNGTLLAVDRTAANAHTADVDANANAIEIACNLASAEESDLRPRVELPRAADELAVMLFAGRSLWFYLTLLGAALIATEWWLYQRRIVG